MTDTRFTNSQSPRASRDSTNDPEKHALGDVKLDMNDPEEDGGPENADAWQHQGKGGDQKYA